MKDRHALVLGASGLVGSELLKRLLETKGIGKVTTLVRKPLNLSHAKLVQIETDFSSAKISLGPDAIDVVFCCIGTTRKKTPDLVEYKAIDYGITMNVARLAQSQGCQEIHLVSSVGANSKSSNFYLAIKGEVEEGIQGLGFTSCNIYRPSMLIGKRNESRPFERIGQVLTPIFDFLTFGGKYHSVHASKLAGVMGSLQGKNGTYIFHFPFSES